MKNYDTKERDFETNSQGKIFRSCDGIPASLSDLKFTIFQ